MGQCRDLNRLNKDFRPIVDYILKIAKTAFNIDLVIIETVRTQEVQSAYFAQGRKTLIEVNELRKKANLYLIDDAENKKIITKICTLDLKKSHPAGLAVDIMPKEGFNCDPKTWDIIGKCTDLAKKLFITQLNNLDATLTWGGEWAMKDKPHLELVMNKKKNIA